MPDDAVTTRICEIREASAILRREGYDTEIRDWLCDQIEEAHREIERLRHPLRIMASFLANLEKERLEKVQAAFDYSAYDMARWILDMSIRAKVALGGQEQ